MGEPGGSATVSPHPRVLVPAPRFESRGAGLDCGDEAASVAGPAPRLGDVVRSDPPRPPEPPPDPDDPSTPFAIVHHAEPPAHAAAERAGRQLYQARGKRGEGRPPAPRLPPPEPPSRPRTGTPQISIELRWARRGVAAADDGDGDGDGAADGSGGVGPRRLRASVRLRVEI